jgi:hypothetical protein
MTLSKPMLIAIVLCMAGALSGAAQKPILEPTDRAVALAGTLSLVHAYGPPGYGEDKRADARVSYWAIKLDFDVTTECTAQRPELLSIQCAPTHILRLFFPVDPEAKGLIEKARSLRDHKVLVTGIVHRQRSMSDYTPVYMDVAEISEVKQNDPVPVR